MNRTLFCPCDLPVHRFDLSCVQTFTNACRNQPRAYLQENSPISCQEDTKWGEGTNERIAKKNWLIPCKGGCPRDHPPSFVVRQVLREPDVSFEDSLVWRSSVHILYTVVIRRTVRITTWFVGKGGEGHRLDNNFCSVVQYHAKARYDVKFDTQYLILMKH